MSPRYINQIELLECFLNQCSADPSAHRYHAIAYADDMTDETRSVVLAAVGASASLEPPRRGNFNLLHLSFPGSCGMLSAIQRIKEATAEAPEMFLFGPPNVDATEVKFLGEFWAHATAAEALYFGFVDPGFALPDDRRRVISKPVLSDDERRAVLRSL